MKAPSLFFQRLGWKSLAEVLTRLFSLLYFVLLARTLGESAYGAYALPLAWASVLGVFIDSGGNTLILREFVRAPDQRNGLWSALLFNKVLTSLLFFLLLLLLAFFIPSTLSFSGLVAAGFILLTQGWMDTLVSMLNAQGKYALEFRLRLLSRFLTLLPQLVVLFVYPDVLTLLWTAALTGGLNTLLAFYLAREFDFVFFFHRERFQRFFKDSLSFWFVNVSWMLYLKVDLVLLSVLGRPESELGWYQAAIRFYELGLLVAYLVSTVLLPILSSSEQHLIDHKRINHYLCLIALLGSGLAGVGLISSGFILPLVLGNTYASSVDTLNILLLGLPYVFMSLLWFAILGAKNLQVTVAIAATLCLFFNVGLNLYFIPNYGFQGAAWATVAADVLLWLLLVSFASKKRLVFPFSLTLLSLLWFPLALLLRYLNQEGQNTLATGLGSFVLLCIWALYRRQ